MRYDWDEAKRDANRQKHGVDFTQAEQMDWGSCLTRIDDRHCYGEARFQTLGLIQGRLHMLVWTQPAPATIRIISLRKANRREIEDYVARI